MLPEDTTWIKGGYNLHSGRLYTATQVVVWSPSMTRKNIGMTECVQKCDRYQERESMILISGRAQSILIEG